MATPISAVASMNIDQLGMIAIGIIIGYCLHWFKGFWSKVTTVKTTGVLK